MCVLMSLPKDSMAYCARVTDRIYIILRLNVPAHMLRGLLKDGVTDCARVSERTHSCNKKFVRTG